MSVEIIPAKRQAPGEGAGARSLPLIALDAGGKA